MQRCSPQPQPAPESSLAVSGAGGPAHADMKQLAVTNATRKLCDAMPVCMWSQTMVQCCTWLCADW